MPRYVEYTEDQKRQLFVEAHQTPLATPENEAPLFFLLSWVLTKR